LIESAALQVSPAVLLELQFLYELGRITAPATEVLRGLQQALDLHVATEPFDRVVFAACAESWTRDPFDRLIVAHARLLNATLLTKDRRIASAYGDTGW
jgi:PIN domain nuclease of toxin-antitoxin system